MDLQVAVATYLGQSTTVSKPRHFTVNRVVIVQDSHFVGRGNYVGTGLDLMWDLGLVSPRILTAIRLSRMGFISGNFMKQFPKERASKLGMYWYIQQ